MNSKKSPLSEHSANRKSPLSEHSANGKSPLSEHSASGLTGSVTYQVARTGADAWEPIPDAHAHDIVAQAEQHIGRMTAPGVNNGEFELSSGAVGYRGKWKREILMQAGQRAPRTHACEPDYRMDPKTERYCWCCQRDLKPGAGRKVYVMFDDMQLVHPADVDAAGLCVSSLMGPECIKKNKVPPEFLAD